LGRLPEIVALRMVRLETLSPDQQASIRAHEEPSLFHLPINKPKYGLAKEMAVDLNALVRVHRTAIVGRVGQLDDYEMRSIGERLAEHLDIDLEPLVSAKVQEHLDELIGP